MQTPPPQHALKYYTSGHSVPASWVPTECLFIQGKYLVHDCSSPAKEVTHASLSLPVGSSEPRGAFPWLCCVDSVRSPRQDESSVIVKFTPRNLSLGGLACRNGARDHEEVTLLPEKNHRSITVCLFLKVVASVQLKTVLGGEKVQCRNFICFV